MTPQEIREKFNPELCKTTPGVLTEGYWNYMAIELLCQLAEHNELQRQMTDSICDQTEELAEGNRLLNEQVEFQRRALEMQLNAVQEANDPHLQAAFRIAMATGMQEVIALWNREHPLQAIRIQRGDPRQPPVPEGIKL